MKVVAKFAIAFFIATCACLALFVTWGARREVRDVRESVAVDLRAFGEGLREGIAAVWARSGEESALAVMGAVASGRGDVLVTWRGVRDAPHTSARCGTQGDDVVEVDVPVDVSGARVGLISLCRHVRSEGDVLRSAILQELGLALGLAVVLGVLVVVLGAALIGQPLRRMVVQAGRIGDGDMTQRLRSNRNDEIGELKRALNRMCDELVSARARLEREAAARVETLEQLRHLDRLRTVGTIASSLAHELGTPLNVLLLRGQSMAAGEVDAADVRSTGATIAAQVNKMSKIVQNILGFARRLPHKGEVRLSRVASDATDLLGTLAKKSKADLSVLVEADATVRGEPVQLEQAVTNLLTNGIRAMPSGGKLLVRVGVDAAARSTPDAPPVRAGFIEVRDEGVGMAPAELERIFEPFFTTRGPGEGTGLGLTVTRGIAEDHGGWIAAKSELGRGSSFMLFVPAVEAS